MFFWALYYNFWAFASADFTARESKPAFHVASISLFLFAHDIGYLLGTLFAEPLIDAFSYVTLLFVLEGLLAGALLFFIPLLQKRSKTEHEDLVQKRIITTSIRHELGLLRKVTVKLLPLLLLGVVISTVDATIWTVTPIIDTVFPQLAGLGGVVLAVNFAPSFFAYTITSSIASRFGKKRSGTLSFLLGAATLALLGVATSVSAYMIISFISAFFFSISYAAIGGAYADYLKESTHLDNEIVGTHDMSTNIGYILGPIVGGTLLTYVQSTFLFTYLGIAVVCVGTVLYALMPKKISFSGT
jgi:predicted MFS family arabinose efflux permease